MRCAASGAPPDGAGGAYCEGRRWVFEGDAEVKSRF